MSEHDTASGAPAVAAAPPIGPEEFDALRELIRQEIGVTLGDSKSAMVAARLARRLRCLGLSSYRDYYRLVREQGPHGPERQQLINCITTNKTDFFREKHHFDYLRDVIFPQWRQRQRRRIRIWSAGCSSGEEPYTLALWLLEHFPDLPQWDVKIIATDVDTDVLAQAENGVYSEERVAEVPLPLRRKYFLRGTGGYAGLATVRPEPRQLVSFSRVNLIEPWPFRERFDLILCRNVMIYFPRETQQRLLARFAAQLQPEGYLFLGHSENVHGPAGELRPLGGTIHRLSAAPAAEPAAPAAPREAPAAAAPADTRTLIVGDVVACDRPALLKTLLGSCVSACLYDPQRGVGGMNHFSLPGMPSDDGACTRYGVNAMELLINEIMKRGGDRRRLRAKVFGGAKVLKGDSEALSIGPRNARFVLDFLVREGIEVVAQCLGGARGMRVHFHPHTGKALVKPLDAGLLREVARDEARYSEQLLRGLTRPPDGGVTLF